MNRKWFVGSVGLFTFLLGAAELQHGPWLFNPDQDSLSIGFATQDPAGAAVDYRPKGTEDWLRRYDLLLGQKRQNDTVHVVDLPQLQAGVEYEYRLIGFDPGTLDEAALSEIKSFRLPNPSTGAYNALITSDLQFGEHARNQEALKKFKANCGVKSVDLFFLLGDQNNQLENVDEDLFNHYLDAMVELGADTHPMVPVRGNHEWRGKASAAWSKVFRHPEGNSYYSFTQGPVFYLVLDCGEDKPDRSPGHAYTDFNASSQFRADQRRWLEEVVKTDAFRQAKFRVVLAHNAPFGQADDYMVERTQELISGLLNGTEATDRIHLWLAAHEHVYIRGNAGSEKFVTFQANDENRQVKRVPGTDWNFTMAANDGPGYGGIDLSGMVLSVTPEALEVRAFDENGTVFDHFRIAPDGSVAELMEKREFLK